MKTSKLLGFLTALLLIVSVSSCTTYVNRRPAYGRNYGYRRPGPPPPPRPYARPYGGYYGRY